MNANEILQSELLFVYTDMTLLKRKVTVCLLSFHDLCHMNEHSYTLNILPLH